MLMPTTTTNIMTTQDGKTSEMVSSSPTTTEGNNISEMQGCNSNSDTFLGAFVGLELALLITLIIGWTCTCVTMKRAQVNQSKR